MKFDFKKIPATAKLVAGKAKLKGKQYAPEILLVTGIVSGVATLVVACRSTLKTPDIIDEAKETVEKIHEASDSDQISVEEYTAEDRKKDLAIVYVQTSAKFIKLYAPTIVLGAVSLTSILASRNIMKTRNAALASAYAVVDKTFKDYRERVVERFGEKVDDELRYNIKARTIERIEVNEDGEAITKRETRDTIDEATVGNDICKIYDSSCLGWEKDADLRNLFLINTQRYLNDKLQAQGHLFLNEVYDALGMQRTIIGTQMGWIYDPEDASRANYIDFGLKKSHNSNFLNGWEEDALLTFNYDGPILNCLKEN